MNGGNTGFSGNATLQKLRKLRFCGSICIGYAWAERTSSRVMAFFCLVKIDALQLFAIQ